LFYKGSQIKMRDDQPEPSGRTLFSRLKKFHAFFRYVKKIAPFALTATATLLALAIYNRFNPPPIPLSTDHINEIALQALSSATPAPAISAQVYQIILPSLVVIRAERQNDTGENGFAIGSGVVINYNGDILTALHVVENSSHIEVMFADGTQTQAVIAVAQPENDIAVLAPEFPPTVFLPATIGGGSRIGDEVFAVGNPLGLTGSLSAGVISGFDRSFKPVGSDLRLEGLIQSMLP
jgi:S1-C subfamily serine protease